MSMHHFSDVNFRKEVLESDLPVLVDFWAEWCGPCKMLAPLVEEVSKEYAGRIKVGKLDVDANPHSATNYGIMSIPTLMFFKGGKVMSQVSGVLTKTALKAKIQESI